jgi:hypothetical protein
MVLTACIWIGTRTRLLQPRQHHPALVLQLMLPPSRLRLALLVCWQERRKQGEVGASSAFRMCT